MTRLRVAFLGTPDFSVPSLAGLVEAGHDVVMVYTQPPRPAGRGQKERPSPVQVWAETASIPVRAPISLRDAEEQDAFAALDLDVAVVTAYGLILPPPILDAPRLGCINVHASLLPRWRGAAPIQRAILAGDSETGVSIMMMEEGLDTGPVLRMETLPITATTDAGQLHDALADLGGRMIAPALVDYAAGRLQPIPQEAEGMTYAAKIEKSEARIDWTEDAAAVLRRIHAFAPWPGAWFTLDGERVKALAAESALGDGPAGEVLDAELCVACGAGAVRITRLQREGKRAAPAADYLRGRAVEKGTRLA